MTGRKKGVWLVDTGTQDRLRAAGLALAAYDKELAKTIMKDVAGIEVLIECPPEKAQALIYALEAACVKWTEDHPNVEPIRRPEKATTWSYEDLRWAASLYMHHFSKPMARELILRIGKAGKLRDVPAQHRDDLHRAFVAELGSRYYPRMPKEKQDSETDTDVPLSPRVPMPSPASQIILLSRLAEAAEAIVDRLTRIAMMLQAQTVMNLETVSGPGDGPEELPVKGLGDVYLMTHAQICQYKDDGRLEGRSLGRVLGLEDAVRLMNAHLSQNGFADTIDGETVHRNRMLGAYYCDEIPYDYNPLTAEIHHTATGEG